MKLEKLKIKGLRKLRDCQFKFDDATFIVGENNVGKSSVFRALELILTNVNATSDDFSSHFNEGLNIIEKTEQEIQIEATFKDIIKEADNWTGFRGRIYVENESRKITYRKTFTDKVKIEMYEQKKELKASVVQSGKVTISSLINSGIDDSLVRSHFNDIEDSQNLNTGKYSSLLASFYEAWDFKNEFDWIENPGGIPQNVISKMPKFILIPAEHKADEINSDKKTALGEIMTTIFEDIVETSENFGKVQEYFVELEKEIDTSNQDTEFGKLMVKVNQTIKTIFPESEILAKVNLTDPKSFLKPKYEIKLGSNIMTDIAFQGTGMVRSTAFSLLKFREDWKKERNEDLRNLIIGFEEPELFLHPNAANQMRQTIYDLAGSTNQIVCTSHSPYMIDLSREKEKQVINNVSANPDFFSKVTSFSVTSEFLKLIGDDKQYVKMLLKIDDYIARAFFAKKILIVEGDTEDVVLRKTISLFEIESHNKIKAEIQILKARGKATIPPLIKYFKALGISNIFVMHDKDTGVFRAEDVNPRILDALGNEENRVMLVDCIENVLEYEVPNTDKPYNAFVNIEKWKSFDDMPFKWKSIVKIIFKDYLPQN
jgi:putative ATP-dependent endonuclease of OLD family